MDEIAAESLENQPPNGQIASILEDAVATIKQSIDGLRADFDTKIKYDESKEQTIDALHRELQDYRADLVLKIMRPLVNDLLALYDDMAQMIGRYQTQEAHEDSPLLRNFEGVLADVEEILARYGYELFEHEAVQHDSNWQRVQKVVETASAEQDRMIARRVRKGLRYDDKIIRPEVVDIFRYTELSMSAEGENDE